MLRSTHRANVPLSTVSPLPEGWTEHKAPTGHTYYHNAALGKSTYERPVSNVQVIEAPQQISEVSASFSNGFAPGQSYGAQIGAQQYRPEISQPRAGHEFQSQRRHQSNDRPKHRFSLPDCAPWVLIKTKLGRRFVHNTETKESFWRYPPNVLKAVVEFDRLEREKRERRKRKEDVDERSTEVERPTGGNESRTVPAEHGDHNEESDEYEEVEVTDEEDFQNPPPKKQKFEDRDGTEGAPVEFDEDDMAYQLQMMGGEYGLHPADYGEDLEVDTGDFALTDDDTSALFRDMLDDHGINPYTPWEVVLEEGQILDDDRYTVYTNMKARQEAFKNWSRDKIHTLNELKAKQVATDPRIPYLDLLQKHASIKLYWPEFKRKYRKEPEMKDSKLGDKEREKLYREHINRLKLPSSTLKADLTAVLKSVPLSALNRSTQMTALPSAIISDLRYISLQSSIRDPLIETWILTLPPAPEAADDHQETEENKRRKMERQKREKALVDREKRVQQEKRRQEKELRFGKGRLREEERELERANLINRRGLKAQLGELETQNVGVAASGQDLEASTAD